jgi:hypothetical protein
MQHSRLRVLIGAGAITVGAMLATIAVPAVAGLTVATANAKPDRCAAIYQAMSDSLDLAQAAHAQGDTANENDWMRTYYTASRNYARMCG